MEHAKTQENNRPKSAESVIGLWAILFPVTYVVHIAEEYIGDFVEFTAKLGGLVLSDSAFLVGNGVFLVAMCVALLWASKQPSRDPWLVVLGTIVAINAFLHVGGTLLASSYSPGTISGLVLWLPLGIVALVRSYGMLPAAKFRFGVLMGLVAHTLIPVAGLGFAMAF